jgi:hypothetical protein
MTSGIKKASGLTLILVVAFFGLASSKKKASSEGMAELQRMSSAVQDIDLAVSASVGKEEYSRRLGDALVKMGNPEGCAKQAIAEIPKPAQKALATEACNHLSRAMDAYIYAKQYFGPRYDPIMPDSPDYTLSEQEFSEAKARFPNLEEPVIETSQNGYKFYSRSAMLQSLWKVAGQESQTAKQAAEKLALM